MKSIVSTLLVILFSVFETYSQSSWQSVNSPVNENFVSVCFVDDSNGWIVSESGTIVSTNDAGNSWQINSYPEYHFTSVHFSDTNHGCIIGWYNPPADSSFILMTSDGGEDWINSQHPGAARLFDVFFINNNIGWTVGWNDPSGWILYTDDGGLTWTRQMTTLGVSGELYGIHFRNETHGHICGVYATFLSTNNGGTIGNGWALNISIPTLGKDLYSVYDFGELQGCAVGADGIVIYTVDNWNNWIQMTIDITDTLCSVTNVEGTQHLWAVGNNGIIIHNQMYILPWEIQATNVTVNLNDICMLSETDGWAVGDNGTILHYSPYSNVYNDPYSEINIYPNPARDILFIQNLQPSSLYQIQIYNIKGKLFYEKNLNGESYLSIDVAKFMKGIYFLRATGIAKTIVKKIVVE